jgi:hypothetical protein
MPASTPTLPHTQLTPCALLLATWKKPSTEPPSVAAGAPGAPAGAAGRGACQRGWENSFTASALNAYASGLM